MESMVLAGMTLFKRRRCWNWTENVATVATAVALHLPNGIVSGSLSAMNGDAVGARLPYADTVAAQVLALRRTLVTFLHSAGSLASLSASDSYCCRLSVIRSGRPAARNRVVATRIATAKTGR